MSDLSIFQVSILGAIEGQQLSSNRVIIYRMDEDKQVKCGGVTRMTLTCNSGGHLVEGVLEVLSPVADSWADDFQKCFPCVKVTKSKVDLESIKGIYQDSAWIEACFKKWGRVLMGESRHFCPDWDQLPIDETCSEFLDCHCKKS